MVLDERITNIYQEMYATIASWLRDFPNLIVSRTFSKAYGLQVAGGVCAGQ